MTSDDGYRNSNSSDDSSSCYGSDSNYNSDLSYGSLPRHKRCLPWKRARLHAAQQAQAHCFPTMSFTPTHPQLRSIPSLWTKLEPENRSPKFPDIYTAPSHSKVPEGHGTIYVVVASIDPADLHSMFTHGAKLLSFCGLDEAAEETLCAQARNATASKTLITPTPNTTHTQTLKFVGDSDAIEADRISTTKLSEYMIRRIAIALIWYLDFSKSKGF
ncbi:hypothetical protein EV421DRAFT_1911289 [Armillaria borealis]|uniref:Uncharacterized protein n=1 Tax=Armillaria borealis TaxID=47425 RepID=A0AA39MF83_9AGAR|nr:hypothetical protein EV421DRAFT_1911289 [Armillaria borealis]